MVTDTNPSVSAFVPSWNAGTMRALADRLTELLAHAQIPESDPVVELIRAAFYAGAITSAELASVAEGNAPQSEKEPA